MANFYEDNADVQFYLERGIDWAPLVELTENHFLSEDGFQSTEEAVEFYGDILRLVGEFAANEVDPHAAQLDREHPKVVDGAVVVPEVQKAIFDQIKEMELYGMCVPRDLGGMNCPLLVFNLHHELFARADVSITAHNGFHGGIAMAMLAFSAEEGTTTFDEESGTITGTRFADEIAEIVAGDAWGSMDITEPDAGSDMARLRCRGTLGEDGTWRVTGPKIYITSGHGKYHFVIARTEQSQDTEDAFAGLAGLSMFLVPGWEDQADGTRKTYVTIDGIEEKLGHNASATVALSFEEAPAHLIGKRGDGFRHMLMLMNNARVGVGFEALGLCEAAYRMARAYAAERVSMGKTIDRHEMIADYLDEMRTDIQAIRALSVHAGWHEELAQKLNIEQRFRPAQDEDDAKATARRIKKHKWIARKATPLLKYYAAERAVHMARMNMQIHGGAGYTTDYGAEKLLRDALVMPVYEGTSQIQALMAMKDSLLGVVKNPQHFLTRSARDKWEAISTRDPHLRRVARLRVIRNRTVRFLLQRLASAKLGELRQRPFTEWTTAMKDFDPKRDFALAMLHAERLCRILTDVKIAEVLLEQAQRFPERGELLERWLERAEPRCRYLEDEIQTTGLRLLTSISDADKDAMAQAAK